MGGRAVEPQLNHHFISTNGVTLHVVEAGPAGGPLVVLLHGFPEYWRGWRYQIPYLAAAGYRVWAPDLRGFNLSSKPKAVHSYSLDEAAADPPRNGRRVHIRPPSTTKFCAVTSRLSSAASHSTMRAMSGG